jgi:transcriptional regulator with GAF, ATPase, and Fis domain
MIRVRQESPSGSKTLRLEGDEILVGRGRDCAVRLRDPAVARRHARILKVKGAYRVEDLGAKDGILLNGQAVRSGWFRVGDRLVMGASRVVLEAVFEEDGSETVESGPAETAPAEPRKRDAEADRLRQLLSLNHRLLEERNPRRLLETIMDTAIELLRAERGFLILADGDRLTFRIARHFGRRGVENPDVEISTSIARTVLDTGKSVLTDDAVRDDRFASMQSVSLLDLRSILCVRLQTASEVVGALYLDNRFERGTFDEADISLAEAFSDQAALAIVNARLHRENARKRAALGKSREKIHKLNERLRRALRRRTDALEAARETLARSTSELGLRYSYDRIVGRSEAMRKILALADRVTGLDMPVLIRGESGTGKELIAHAIHYNGPRGAAPFVSENCAAIPDELLESELFGHVRGAFTGAERDAVGLFELVNGGTLFLDEVGDMSPSMQSKILRVLEDGKIRRVGATESVEVDFRLIAATNRDLEAMRADGSFRDDLFYRLSVVPFSLPPLRERREDIPALVEHVLEVIAAEGAESRRQIDPEALAVLCAGDWPGNVRQLSNELNRACALAAGTITPAHLSPDIRHSDAGEDADQRPLREVVEELERRLIKDVLKRTGGNKTRASEILGLSRLGLRKKIERYGVEPDG